MGGVRAIWGAIGMRISRYSSRPTPPLRSTSTTTGRYIGYDLPDWVSGTNPATSPSHRHTAAPEYGETARVINGKSIAASIKSEIVSEIHRMKNDIGKQPGLAVILVGNRSDSHSFVGIKKKACDKVGIASFLTKLSENCKEDDIFNLIGVLNKDPSVHGIIVQLPLPKHLDEARILSAVSPEKDVDGLHPLNMGRLAMTGRNPLFIPCAAKGIIDLLLRSEVELVGANAVVVGRSMIVGLPASLLLQRHKATVSVVHSFTKDPKEITREADILITDVGVPNFVRGSWLKPGAFVIDAGTNAVEASHGKPGFHLVGDVCYEEALKVASCITPVPGGLGPITISMLLSNVLDSATRAYGFT